MRRTMCVRLCGLLWLISLIGCGRAVNRSVERRIRESLPDLLGSASEYRVHVSSAFTRTLQGRLADVTVDGKNVQFANGLLLDSLHLDLKGVDSDLTHRKLRHIDSAQFAASIWDRIVSTSFSARRDGGRNAQKDPRHPERRQQRDHPRRTRYAGGGRAVPDRRPVARGGTKSGWSSIRSA